MEKWAKILIVLLLGLSVYGCSDQGSDSENTSESIKETGYGYDDAPRYDWVIPEDSFTRSNSILYVREIGDAAGENAIVPTHEWGVGATDLGFPVYDKENERMYFVWGDTFSGSCAWTGKWTSSAMLYTDDRDFSKGIMYDGVVEGRQGTLSVTPITNNVAQNQNNFGLGLVFDDDEVTGSILEVWTNIPTGGVVVDGTIYVFYMEVGRFGSNTWDTYSGRVVKSVDGKTWELCEELIWQGKDENEEVQNAANFNQIFPYDDGEYIYIYGIPGGRMGGVKLGRVLREKIEKFEEYEYFAGYESDGKTPIWIKGTEGLNAVGKDNYQTVDQDESYLLQRSGIGEVCVFYNEYLNQYLMTYFTNDGSAINMHYSATPYGPWSTRPMVICQTGDVGVGMGIYAGLSHQMMSTNQGQRIFMIISETHNSIRTIGYIPKYIEIVFK